MLLRSVWGTEVNCHRDVTWWKTRHDVTIMYLNNDVDIITFRVSSPSGISGVCSGRLLFFFMVNLKKLDQYCK